jgi:hypothetical protein
MKNKDCARTKGASGEFYNCDIFGMGNIEGCACSSRYSSKAVDLSHILTDPNNLGIFWFSIEKSNIK